MTKFMKILFVVFVVIVASVLTQFVVFGSGDDCTGNCFNESAAEAYCESYCVSKGSSCKSVGSISSCSCIGTTCRCSFWFECWNGQEYRHFADYSNCPQCEG